jgi:flagellar basal body P-ring protein FlgI
MKKSALTIVLLIFTAFLALILYLFIQTSPKHIKNEQLGSMYTFSNISFNFTSDEYTLDQTLIDAAKAREMNNIAVYTNPFTKKTITLIKNEKDSTSAIIIEETINQLRNPYKHLMVERDLSREFESKEDLTLYLGNNKYGVVQRSIDSQNKIIYFLDLKIGSDYYTLIVHEPNSDNIEDIMEFLRTVYIANN